MLSGKYSVWLIAFYFIVGPQVLWGSAVPNWSVDASNYAYSMQVVAEVALNQAPVTTGSHLLGVFVNGECRGVAQPMQTGGRTLYFMNVYSNTLAGDTLHFKFYHAWTDAVYSNPKLYLFERNSFLGNVGLPTQLQFMPQDDFPISFKGIPDQITVTDKAFPDLNVRDYLEQTDQDQIYWQVRGEGNLNLDISGSGVLQVSPKDPLWAGTETVEVQARESGPIGFTATVRITYKVQAYIPFVFNKLPYQAALPGDTFQPIDLNLYLYPQDACRTYAYNLLPLRGFEEDPIWSIEPGGANTMAINAQVEYDGRPLAASGSKLAVFVNGMLRGVATPIWAAGKYWYFLTGNNGAPGNLTFQFYDSANRYLYTHPTTVPFQPNGALGSVASPYVVQLDKMGVEIDSTGILRAHVQDSTWRGTQLVEVVSIDCENPTFNRDTTLAAFRVWDDLSGNPVFESPDSVSYVEGSCRELYRAEAYDFGDEAGGSLRYFIQDGGDGARFVLDEISGLLSWVEVPDYEMPLDSNADNQYHVTLVVRDIDGKMDTLELQINVLNKVQEGGLSASIVSSRFLCGPDNGATLVASGGPQYRWNTGATEPSIRVFSAGKYTVTVSDEETGCALTASETIVEASLNLTVSSATVEDAPIKLSGQQPLGGTFSGPGIVGDTLYPALAGGGQFPVRYTISNGQGCTKVLVSEFSVYPFPGELGDCGCRDIQVSLNSAGFFTLSAKDITQGDCTNGLIRVADTNPGNRNRIDCVGDWEYGLFDAQGKLKCKGRVVAEDRSGPLLAQVRGRCNRVVSDGVRPGLDTIWRDTFLCTDIGAVFQNPKSWSTTGGGSNYPYFAGGVRFEGVTDPSCACSVSVFVQDKITYLPCSQRTKAGAVAVVERIFTGKDCHGNSTEVRQEIILLHPGMRINQIPQREIVLSEEGCKAVTSQQLLEIFKRNYYVFDDPYSCTPVRYGYFSESLKVQGGTTEKLLTTHGSFDIVVKSQTTLCSNGLQMEAVVRYQDGCSGRVEEIDTVLLFWVDAQAPVYRLAEPAVVLSTGVSDSTATFGIDVESLKTYFGLEIADQCSVAQVEVEVWSCTDQQVSGIPVGEVGWRMVPYDRFDSGNRRLVRGVPVGRHRLRVRAWDGCGNRSEVEVPFTVVDKIAPVVACKDTLRIAISAGARGGYAQVTVKEMLSRASDKSGIAWVRARRTYDPSMEADYIEYGYDSDGDGKITMQDGKDWNGDGYIGDNPNTDVVEVMERFEFSASTPGVWMTPALNEVALFCADLDKIQQIELWASDNYARLNSACALPGGAGIGVSGGNLNYCTTTVTLEDVVSPAFSLPDPAILKCTDGAILDTLKQTRTVALQSSTYAYLAEQVFLAQGKGRFKITQGTHCREAQVEVSIKPNLTCTGGAIELSYAYIQGKERVYIGSTQIQVDVIRTYSLRFPEDRSGICTTVLDTAQVVDVNGRGCSVLGVQVTDKRYPGGEGCYRIFRTFTVVDWCAYKEACGDPTQWAVVVTRDPAQNGNNGVNVLVRDLDRALPAAYYYEDIAGSTTEGYNPGNREVSADDMRPDLSGFPLCSATTERFAWMFTQHLTVYDTIAPELQAPELSAFTLRESSCTAAVSIPFSARDVCAAPAADDALGIVVLDSIRVAVTPTQHFGLKALAARYGASLQAALDVQGKTIPNSWTFTGTFPAGSYTLYVAGRDGCGNLSSEKAIPFQVVDQSISAPICYAGLSTTLALDPATQQGISVLWATDFKGSDIADCSGQELDANGRSIIGSQGYFILKDSDGNGRIDSLDGVDHKGIPRQPTPSVTFDCKDMRGDTVRNVLVRLYARDAAGNWSWCDTYTRIHNRSGVCEAIDATFGALAGATRMENGKHVQGVEIQLSGAAQMEYQTDSTGTYSFNGLLKEGAYTVTPYLDKNFNTGISTLDVIWVTRHILGRQPLTTPYQRIAADVNNSKTISTFDVIQLRQIVLNRLTRFPNNTSWRFVDASFHFPDTLDPWKTDFPEKVHAHNLEVDRGADFIAVKVGDVNGSATAGVVPRSQQSQTPLIVETTDLLLRKGKQYRIPIVADLSQVLGMQFTLELDLSAVQLIDVEAGLLSAEHLGVFVPEGIVTASWNGETPVSGGSKPILLTLLVEGKADQALHQVLRLSSRYTASEAYTLSETIIPVAHQFIEVSGEPSEPQHEFEVVQNQPNPFAQETMIGFTLPQAGIATIAIHDMHGRLLRQIEREFSKGYNQVWIKAAELGAAGVFTYTIQSGTYTATRSMVRW